VQTRPVRTLTTSRESAPTTPDTTADSTLNKHVATLVATDGGVVSDAETDHAKLFDDSDTTDLWDGTYAEYNQYGESTSHEYVRCRACGVEVINDRRDDATHRGDCRYRTE